jgi:hypothetical protein
MALVTVPQFIIGAQGLSGSAASVLLDALDEYVAFLFTCPVTDTYDRVHFGAGTITAAGDALRMAFEGTVDGPPMTPDFTPIGSIVSPVPSASAWNRGPAGMGASLTAGVTYFVRIYNASSGTPFNGNIRRTHVTSALQLSFATQTSYYVENVTGSPVSATHVAPLALETASGVVYPIPGFVPIVGSTTVNYNSGSTPDEVGNRIVMPFGVRAIGFYTGSTYGNDAVVDHVLYDESSGVLKSITWGENKNRAASQSPGFLLFGRQILSKDQVVRTAEKPNAVSITRHILAPDLATSGNRLRDAIPYSGYVKLTHRTDAGAWTDTDDQYYVNGLVCDQIDVGAAAAAAVQSPMYYPRRLFLPA